MKRISIFVLLVLPLLLQSCLKEHTSMCESWLLLRFRYTLNDQYADLFGTEVHKMTIYVFDAEGKYAGSFSEQGSQLTNDYVMRIPLPEGNYSVVAYGGDFNTFLTGELSGQVYNELRKGLTDLSAFRTELKNSEGEENYLYPVASPDDFYAGFVANAVAAIGNQEITDVELMKDTKNVIVRITDVLPAAVPSAYAAAMPYEVYITALNGRYTADNNIDLNHGTLKYAPIASSAGENTMEARLKTMRLMLGQTPRLVVRNSLTSEVIYNENMIDQILLNPKYKTQQDIDREDEFVFEIGVQAQNNNVQITVSINGWKINSVTPGI